MQDTISETVQVVQPRKPQKPRVNVMTKKPAGTGMPKNVPPEEPDGMPKKPRSKHRKRGQKVVVKAKQYYIKCRKWVVKKKCVLYTQVFGTQKELNHHTIKEHKYKFMCSDHKCGLELSSAAALKKHTKHHKESDYICEACRATFPYVTELEQHSYLHYEVVWMSVPKLPSPLQNKIWGQMSL